MPQRKTYAQGTPSWIDISCKDIEATKSFYSALFDWSFEETPTDEGPPYIMIKKGDSEVAGLMKQPPEQEEMPAWWNVYAAVDNVDSTTEKAKAAGAQVLMAPTDIMDAGRMSFIMDPFGAALGLWQSNKHVGATVVNEPGAFTWAEIFAPDTDKVDTFYNEVLGLEKEVLDMGDEPYNAFKAGDRTVAGTMPPPMEGVPSHWHTYFGTADCAKTVEDAKAAGGTVKAGPFDTPVGKIAVLQDPQGAVFSVIQLNDWPEK